MTDDPARTVLTVDPRLLEVLICPVSRQGLSYDREANVLISRRARLAFPIRGGIPILVEGEAADLDDPPVPARTSPEDPA
jgi:uncharacterized protein